MDNNNVEARAVLPSLVNELFALLLTFLLHRDIGRLKCIFRRFPRHRELLDEEAVLSSQEYDEKQELLETRLCWLAAVDCNILLGENVMSPSALGHLYQHQYKGTVFGHVGRSIVKLIKEYPQLLTLENNMVKATRHLERTNQHSPEIEDQLATISKQEVKPTDKKGKKKSHAVSKSKRQRKELVDHTIPEETARSALLKKFGCSTEAPFYYHTLLHSDFSSYQEAWRIAKANNNLDERCVGAIFEQSVCPLDHDLVLFYMFKQGYSPQDLAQVIEANRPFVVITCEESSSDEGTPPITSPIDSISPRDLSDGQHSGSRG